MCPVHAKPPHSGWIRRLVAAVDRVGLGHHALSKRAKDLGSAAVLISLGNSAVVWGFVLPDGR